MGFTVYELAACDTVVWLLPGAGQFRSRIFGELDKLRRFGLATPDWCITIDGTSWFRVELPKHLVAVRWSWRNASVMRVRVKSIIFLQK